MPIELNHLCAALQLRPLGPVALEPFPDGQRAELPQLVQGQKNHRHPFAPVPAAPGARVVPAGLGSTQVRRSFIPLFAISEDRHATQHRVRPHSEAVRLT